MSGTVNLRSRFTPSLMSHELLERLFVAHEKTLDRILERVTAAGPRGSGKTHLVSLVYHRARSDPSDFESPHEAAPAEYVALAVVGQGRGRQASPPGADHTRAGAAR